MRIVLLILVLLAGSFPAAAQEKSTAAAVPGEEPKTDSDDKKIRFSAGMMYAYTFDPAQASLGFEKQGRLGYVKIEIAGKLNNHLRYVAVLNPVSENEPLPSCGEENYFFPNTPQNIGPNVRCDSNGRTRVDDYRSVALDPLMQQGPIREAYLEVTWSRFGLKAGRFILPIGFGLEEAGSFTAKDAPHIQRIDAEASFGFELSYAKMLRSRRLATVSFIGILGDGNKFRDYDYFYFLDGSLDSNSWPTMIVSGNIMPLAGLEFRAALKRGHTGSKVERLPNLFASKRNDHALVLSAQYRPVKYVRVFGESASYTWGLVESSADLLDLPEMTPIGKSGYYYGVEASYPVRQGLSVGTVLTREELSRDDTLVQWLASQNLYGVSMGKKERSTALRFYADIAGAVRVGFFRNDLSNPFPQASGIAPVSGPRAYESRGGGKWGVVVRLTVR